MLFVIATTVFLFYFCPLVFWSFVTRKSERWDCERVKMRAQRPSLPFVCSDLSVWIYGTKCSSVLNGNFSPFTYLYMDLRTIQPNNQTVNILDGFNSRVCKQLCLFFSPVENHSATPSFRKHSKYLRTFPSHSLSHTRTRTTT